jgi:N-methylhydantoinase A
MARAEAAANARNAAQYAVGVDVGGTFTDLVLADLRKRELHRFKTLTTPGEPSRGMIDGLTALVAQAGIRVADLGYVVHATTLVTNAIIERKGRRTGLITSAGMRDVLEIGRESRYDLYDLYLTKPEALVPRNLRFEVRERLRADGAVHLPLEMDSVDAAARALIERDVETVAICLINSYRNPEHERAIKAHLAKNYPQLDVSLSSDISREAGEYERSSTAAANAYVRPMVRGYLTQLAGELAALGFAGPLEIMLSDGGVCSVETAIRFPVRLIESGPAAGVRAAAFMAGQLGLGRVLSFDMGGTTAKISFVDDGIPASAASFEAARVDRARQGSGLPLQIPTVELLEIGAGGGSIAAVDGLGLLKVGPESAGADPGPAAYGRGGLEPTITDMHLLLGVLSPAIFGFGALRLDTAAATAAAGRLAAALNIGMQDAAGGVINLVNEHMTNAIRLYAAERARDLRDYTLVAYGGAGPIHAYELARILGIRRLIYPWGAGTLSAFGLLMSPRSMSVGRSLPVRIGEITGAEIEKLIASLEDDCYANLATTGVDRDACVSSASVTLRYAGQGHELAVPLAVHVRQGGYRDEAIRAEFERQYAAVFGRALDGLPLEAVTWRVQMTAPSATSGTVIKDVSLSPGKSVDGRRKVYFHECGAAVDAAIHPWDKLKPGEQCRGPAVFESEDCTVVVGPAGSVVVDSFRNLVVEIGTP